MQAVNIARGWNHIARLQEALYWCAIINKCPYGVYSHADLSRLWSHNGKRCIRSCTACGHCSDNDRLPGDVLDVALRICEPDADRRLRVVLERHVVREILRDQVGEQHAVPCCRAILAPVVPAIAIHILVRVVDVRVYVGEREAVFPPAFHEIMVCDNLAVVLIRLDVATAVVERLGRTEIVVRHTLVGLRRIGVQRADELPAVRNAIRIRAEADEVFRVVRKPVLVGVVVGALSGDAK